MSRKASNIPAVSGGPSLAGVVLVLRGHRLKKSADFERVRSTGRCWSDPCLVICKRPNDLSVSRFGFSVSKRIGNAVKRNRIKRLMREVMRIYVDLVVPGWDVVFIARTKSRTAGYWDIEDSMTQLLSRAELFRSPKLSAEPME